jgi:cytoskeletal protein RodZ
VLMKVLYLYLLLLYAFTAESRPPVKHDSILSLHHASSKSRGSLSDSPAHSSLPSSSSSDDEDDSDSDINVTNDTEDVPTEIETKTTEATTTGVGENSVTTGIIVSASTTAHEDAGGCVPLTCGNGNIGDRCGVIPNGCGKFTLP